MNYKTRWPKTLLLSCLVAGCSLTGLAGGAAAETRQARSDLSLMGVYIEPDSQRTDKYGTAFRATYGKRLSESWWLEPTLFSGVIEAGRTGLTDYYQQGAGVDFSYRLPGERTFTPFGLIGAGVSRNDVANHSDSEFGGYGNLGLGVLTSAITDSGLRLRAEVRYVYDTFDDGLSDVHLAAGITLPIGTTRSQVVEKIRYIEKPVVIEKEKLVGMADSDSDGVVDGVDQCPNTLEGLQVNAVGCVETDREQSVVLSGVSFEFNSDRLTANAKDILAKTADALRGQPDLRVELAGHTDSVGSANYNQQLSQKRADAVRNHLIDSGIAPERLVANGYGESRPVRSNSSEEGRERNRRVEFNVIQDSEAE